MKVIERLKIYFLKEQPKKLLEEILKDGTKVEPVFYKTCYATWLLKTEALMRSRKRADSIGARTNRQKTFVQISRIYVGN
jgi:hypothetical protein